MGNLAAAITAQENRTPGPRCGVENILKTLDATDAAALRNALQSDLQGSKIAAALRSEGHHMKGHTIQRHRNGECGCAVES